MTLCGGRRAELQLVLWLHKELSFPFFIFFLVRISLVSRLSVSVSLRLSVCLCVVPQGPSFKQKVPCHPFLSPSGPLTLAPPMRPSLC